MRGFIEVTEGKRKTLIAVSEIKVVAARFSGKAAIYLKEYCRPGLFSSGADGVACEETYETVCDKIAKAHIEE